MPRHAGSSATTTAALKDLIGIALSSAVLVGVANILWVYYRSNGGRVLQTGFFFLLPLFSRIGFYLMDTPHPWLATYYELDGWVDMLAFLPRVVLSLLVCNLVLALEAWMIFVVFMKSAPARKDTVCLLVRTGYAALILSPIIFLPAENLVAAYMYSSGSWVGVWSRIYAIGISAVVCLTVWFAFARLDSNRDGSLLSMIAARAGAILGFIVFAGWVFTAIATKPQEKPPASGPNVLLVSIDSLRADGLHCYGNPNETSPNIDQLAKEGVRFHTAVTPTSWSLPSHMSLLTGLDPMHHGVISDFTRLPRNAITLAEVLQHNGYSTAAFVSNAYLRAAWGYYQGFDVYDDYSATGRIFGGKDLEVSSPLLIQKALTWLSDWDANGKQRPFFLFLHMMDVHHDYLAPTPYDKMFDPLYKGSITGKNFLADKKINRNMASRDLQHILALYDGEVRYVDEHLGKILADLSKRDALDNTIIAVTSDHGDEFFEHGEKGHRKSLYDEALLVPMVIRYPKYIPSNTVVQAPVRLIDLGSTLLRLAGIKETLGYAKAVRLYAARDLSPLILSANSDSPATSDTKVEEAPAFLHLSEVYTGKPGPTFGIRRTDAKLIIRPDGKTLEFYDLRADPAERYSLDIKKDARARSLKSMLDNWKRRGLRNNDGRPVRLDASEIEQLKALGYLQ